MENWQEILSRIESSGLSIAQYCRENGLKPHTVRYWKQKRAEQTSPSGFVAIQTEAVSALEIVYPNGVRLKLASGFPLAELKKLLYV